MQLTGPNKVIKKSADIFLKHLLTTDTYTDSFAAFLRLNDDDNNPATVAPDECKIRKAFSRHGLTPNEDCVDKEEGIKIMLSEASKDGSVLLQASAFGAKEIILCRGDVESYSPNDGSI